MRVICEEDVNDFKLDFDKVLVNNKLFNFKKGSTINKGKLGIVVRNENDVINDLISKGFKLENGVYVNGNFSPSLIILHLCAFYSSFLYTSFLIFPNKL